MRSVAYLRVAERNSQKLKKNTRKMIRDAKAIKVENTCCAGFISSKSFGEWLWSKVDFVLFWRKST